MTANDFTVKTIDDRDLSLAAYQGRVLLVVNVASQCGFAAQNAGLEELYRKYKSQGLEVLAFPCNQFGNQEPGSSPEIKSVCELRYRVTFPMFAKVEVNGPRAEPFYKFLKEARPGIFGTRRIKWNYTKFLVDRAGKPVARYSPMTRPAAMEGKIRLLLGAA